jgi:uncharacterized membrane protein
MNGWTLLVAAHAFAASVALPLGGYQLLRRRKGDHRHRVVGWTWVVAMTFVATSSFAIRDLRDGKLSLLHVLSVVTLASLISGIVGARRGSITQHRAGMRGTWLGLFGAFIGAVAVPSRLIPTFMVTSPLGALAAFGAVLVTAAVVVVLAGLPVPRPRARTGGLRGLVVRLRHG